jgi:hypothetical protein
MPLFNLSLKHRNQLFILVLIALVAVLLYKNNSKSKQIEGFEKNQRNLIHKDVREKKSKSDRNKGNFTDNEADVNRHPEKIEYSKHARCRMECRHFTKDEVIDILEHGKINFDKSNDRPGQCPTYALEGVTQDNQKARMVFSFCESGKEVTVVTVIDLDTDWECSCY